MALHVEHITKTFGEKTAVDDLSFSMEHSGVFDSSAPTAPARRPRSASSSAL